LIEEAVMSKDKPAPRAKLLTQAQRERTRGLLDMLYSPAELVDELALANRDYVYHTLLKHGLPSLTDKTGHVWIHGTDVLPWYIAYCEKRKHKTRPDQAYCLKCKQARQVKPETREIVPLGNVKMQKANCAVCDTVTYKVLPSQAPDNNLKHQAWTKVKHKKQEGRHDQS
jgi:hypothetical protein